MLAKSFISCWTHQPASIGARSPLLVQFKTEMRATLLINIQPVIQVVAVYASTRTGKRAGNAMEIFIIRQPAQVTRNAFQTIVTMESVTLWSPDTTVEHLMTVLITTVFARTTYVIEPQVDTATIVHNVILVLLATEYIPWIFKGHGPAFGMRTIIHVTKIHSVNQVIVHSTTPNLLYKGIVWIQPAVLV